MPFDFYSRPRDTEQFKMDVAGGFVDGITANRKYGRATSVPNGSYVPLWTYSSVTATYPFPTTASTMFVDSTASNDSSTGTRARKVTIEGLDSLFNEQTEQVTLSGSTAVQTTSSFIRINRLYVSDVGTYGTTNQGAIRLASSSGFSSGSVLGHIPATFSQSQQVIYTVPNGKTGYFTKLFVAAETAKAVSFRELIRLDADITSSAAGEMKPFRIIAEEDGVVAPANVDEVGTYELIPSKTDFVMEVTQDGAGSSATAAGFVNFFLRAE